MNILDIRDLADDYQAEIDKDPTFAVAHSDYSDLCAQLGVERTPEALREFGERYEPTLIAESDFEDYAQELATDCDLIDPEAKWPLNYIDWESAANELAHDYTMIIYDGQDFYIRIW